MELRKELQTYLNKEYSDSKIETPHSIFGAVHIRFELGGDEMFKIIRNGLEIEYWNDRRRMTKVDKMNEEAHINKSVTQATYRATTVFNETFDDLEREIWVLIYEYENGLFNDSRDYLYTLFPKDIFYNKLEQVDTQMTSFDDSGKEYFDKTEAKVILGKIKVKKIKAEKILQGITNNEMGFEPAISQDVYFLDPVSNKGFYMYDDRGCYVWSNKASNIRKLYNDKNDWIVDYHRSQIDKYFNK
jgi:hypothetical protein